MLYLPFSAFDAKIVEIHTICSYWKRRRNSGCSCGGVGDYIVALCSFNVHCTMKNAKVEKIEVIEHKKTVFP